MKKAEGKIGPEVVYLMTSAPELVRAKISGFVFGVGAWELVALWRRVAFLMFGKSFGF